MKKHSDNEPASAGHQLGQLVGAWFERYFAFPLLTEVAQRLSLYLDCGQNKRSCRDDKVIWFDVDGNAVDYDFVMELGGRNDTLGVPIAFLETFWRRGKRHSKDKARDDSGKLIPMRETYPTARFLGIIAAGDFTAPATQLVRSREIDLFYVPKAKVVEAFSTAKIQIDYPDKLPEQEKLQLVSTFQRKMNRALAAKTAVSLRELVGEPIIKSYVDRVRGSIGALPQELRIIARKSSTAAVFESISETTQFLKDPQFIFDAASDDYVYEITYSDGAEFHRELASIDELRALHGQTERLGQHVEALMRN